MNKRPPFANGEYYHVFNRGVARQPIFFSALDYKQALRALDFYRFSNPPVRLSRLKELSIDQRLSIMNELYTTQDVQAKIASYVFMPNHFHFLLQQVAENGIPNFLSKFTNSYTKYINTKDNRVGPLLQGTFKAVRIETTEQLLHVSRYIHLNPLIGFVVKEKGFLNYPYSSLPDFLKGKSSVVTLDTILQNFPSTNAYKQFIVDQIDYARTLEEIKHLTLED